MELRTAAVQLFAESSSILLAMEVGDLNTVVFGLEDPSCRPSAPSSRCGYPSIMKCDVDIRKDLFVRQGCVVRWRRHVPRDWEQMAKEYNESYAKDFLFSVPVSVEVSLGVKLAQLRGECWHAHGLDTVTPLHMCFPLSQSCCVHSITLPTHSRWLKLLKLLTKQTSI